MQRNNVFFDIAACQSRIEKCLHYWLDIAETQALLLRAMHYSVLGGGKRMRPLLVYATGFGFAADPVDLDPAAVAVELIHSYSLVHDDLPPMDNDDFRRGQPSCHKAFGEATAILVGDALQSLAFTVLANDKLTWPLDLQMAIIKTLARASGAEGMVAGQMLDMLAEGEGSALTLASLEILHHLKTGALIRASVRLGALAAGCRSEELLQQLDQFAAYLGLAFQVQDDLLDVESTTEILGKSAGADAIRDKTTYPRLLGVEASKHYLQDLYARAGTILEEIPIDVGPLRQIVLLLQERQC